MFALGGVICIIGVVMGVGGAEAAEIDIENDATYSGTSGTWYHDNADLYIVYVKSNVDCESFSASMTDSEGSSGSMFVDNLEVYDCEDWESTEEGDFVSAGYITVDVAGDFTMESSSPIYIIGGGEELGEAVGGAFAMLGGFGMLCCGGFFLLLGGIFAITLKKAEPQVVVVNQAAPGSAAPAATHMAAPQYEQPQQYQQVQQPQQYQQVQQPQQYQQPPQGGI